MISERIEGMLNLSGICKLMVFDLDGIFRVFDYTSVLSRQGFRIVRYDNIEAFRLEYEETIKTTDERIAVLVENDIYVPYDIQQRFQKRSLSLDVVFPRLHADTLMKYACDIDLVSYAYDECYEDLKTHVETKRFINNTALSEAVINNYCIAKTSAIKEHCENAARYTDWIQIAKMKASTQYYATMADIDIDLSFVDAAFKRFTDNGYAQLSSEIGIIAPAIVTKTLGFIFGANNPKVAIIVMDGMSLFDFEVLSRFFSDIEYTLDGTFAIIPTTTPISRQSLLSGKYPRELDKPFTLAGEEKEFISAGEYFGYARNQIQYLRGYEPNISHHAKLIAVIINEVDDIVHGQRQQRTGMLTAMRYLGKEGKLQSLVISLVQSGFEVYIVSDHGNTPCVGVGGFRSGVEMESKSMRMVVLKDFADKHDLVAKYATEYPGHYLDKNHEFYVCEPGVSYDSKGEKVMTHGGMTIDEVIVPFVKIKGVK